MSLRASWLVAAVLLLPESASAHALLRHASPGAGQTLPTAPAEVAIDFSEQPEPAFSTIVVRDSSGLRVDKADVHAAPGNAKRLVVGLGAAGKGTYRVTWHVTSVDTHVTDGHYEFTVGP